MSAALVDTDPLQAALARIAELETQLSALRGTPPHVETAPHEGDRHRGLPILLGLEGA